MPFGLTLTGFLIKTLTDIKEDFEAAFKAAFGASINLTPKSNFSQVIGINSERLAEAWEVAQAVDSGFDPDKAEGQRLDGICAITGTIRNEATESTVTMTLVGTTGTVVDGGSVASVDGIGTRFETLDDATIAAVSAWAPATAYGLGVLVKNDGNVYVCTDDGTSAGSGGPTGSGTAITDNTATWRFLGAGDGAVRVEAEAQETGPKIAAQWTLTTIETPVSGWAAVTNEEDAVLGVNEEKDPALRIRREEELLGESASVVHAILKAMRAVENVTSVVVFVNDTEITDGDGMPPHSVEALVRGGDDQEIREALYRAVAGGISYHGNTSGTVTDADNGGQTYTIKFSRPEEITIYVIANVTKDPNFFPADGATQIRDAIVAYGAAGAGGRDVHAKAVAAQCFGTVKEVDGLKLFVPIPGVINVPTCYIGTSPAPATETSVTISLRQLAVINTGNVTVNVSNGTP